MYPLKECVYYWQIKELFFDYECFYFIHSDEYGGCLAYLNGCKDLSEDLKFYNFHSLLEFLEKIGFKFIY